jgi:hypothetical protein
LVAVEVNEEHILRCTPDTESVSGAVALESKSVADGSDGVPSLYVVQLRNEGVGEVRDVVGLGDNYGTRQSVNDG